jgi:hypothetical protein
VRDPSPKQTLCTSTQERPPIRKKEQRCEQRTIRSGVGKVKTSGVRSEESIRRSFGSRWHVTCSAVMCSAARSGAIQCSNAVHCTTAQSSKRLKRSPEQPTENVAAQENLFPTRTATVQWRQAPERVVVKHGLDYKRVGVVNFRQCPADRQTVCGLEIGTRVVDPEKYESRPLLFVF